MFEQASTPAQVYRRLLGAALAMEQANEKMLGDLAEAAQSPMLKEIFTQHRVETQGQVEAVKKVFGEFGWRASTAANATIAALAKDARSAVKATAHAVVDTEILAAAMQTEHYEIAVYEALITYAESAGAPGVVPLLQGILGQEQQALRAVREQAPIVAAVVGRPRSG